MPATPLTPEQLALQRALAIAQSGMATVKIMDHRELIYPVHWEPGGVNLFAIRADDGVVLGRIPPNAVAIRETATN